MKRIVTDGRNGEIGYKFCFGVDRGSHGQNVRLFFGVVLATQDRSDRFIENVVGQDEVA